MRFRRPVLNTGPSTLVGPAGRVSTERRARDAGTARQISAGVILAALLALFFAVALSVGDFPIPVADVVPAIFGFGNPDSHFIVQTLRLPRALSAVFVGGAFGLSGAIFQGLARNPLASPDIMGITSGAAATAVFLIVILEAGGLVVSLGAFAGALATAAVIYAVAYRKGISSYRLVLVGIGIAAVLSSVTSYLLTRAEIWDTQRATVWLTGSLNGRGWEHVRPVGLAMLVLLPWVMALARPLRAMQLGDDAARGLGVAVESQRRYLILAAVGLAAVATASAGPVAFVAFVAPAIARRLTRSSLTLLPSALAGALLLLVSDLAARKSFAPVELPAGIVTGSMGAPYLLWLLARGNRLGRAG
ncbi:MAG TPA: iron chelate uptake ABC transporter family permease subunit [Actinomycetota bacterium]|nr:iron chelate uptake ABC transporter family permease subunit [Actinomycetota bacterium]